MKALLFDFDGTLADTMEDNFLAWESAFNEFNVKIKREDYFPIEGLKLNDAARIIKGKYYLNEENDKIVELKNKYYLLNNKFKLYPKVQKIINELKNRYKIAIVTASPREKIEKTAFEFIKNFEVVVTGDDYKNGKPDAEPYLVAMKKLRIENKECIVIENAPLGIEAAKNAGCFCIAVCSTLDRGYLNKADRVVDKIDDILDIL